jgi:hypothetical protein
MLRLDLNQKIHYTLRIAVAMCFIGHGAFGIITKAVWCNYFGVFGISRSLSFQLMPVAGCFDIFLGIVMLLYPMRAILAWLVFWGITTALLRPLSGEPFAEFIERAGNFGVPLALLLVSGNIESVRDLFTRIKPAAQLDSLTLPLLKTCLKIVVFLLLAGHGWLNVIGKSALLNQYRSMGFSNPVEVAQIVGMAEIVAAFLVLIKPLRPLLFIVFIWKMGSEIFYPQYALFEWIERGGSYGSLLALWLITEKASALRFGSDRNYSFQKNVIRRSQNFE